MQQTNKTNAPDAFECWKKTLSVKAIEDIMSHSSREKRSKFLGKIDIRVEIISQAIEGELS